MFKKTLIASRIRGKRRGLGRDSFLSLHTCNLSSLNLFKLLSGKQFLVSYSLNINRYGIDLHSLVNIKANGFLFINRPLAKRLS
jgi:hypothetical protein